MANLLTSEQTYATYENAVKKLEKFGVNLETERWLIGAKIVDGKVRFVPTLVGAQYARYAGFGIMIVG